MLVTRFSLKLCQSSVFPARPALYGRGWEGRKKVTYPKAHSARRDVLKLRLTPWGKWQRKVIDWAQWPISSPLRNGSVKTFFLIIFLSLRFFFFCPPLSPVPEIGWQLLRWKKNTEPLQCMLVLKNRKRALWLFGPFYRCGFQVHSHLLLPPYCTLSSCSLEAHYNRCSKLRSRHTFLWVIIGLINYSYLYTFLPRVKAFVDD